MHLNTKEGYTMKKNKRNKRIVDSISSMIFGLLIVGFIAAHIFNVNILFLSDLTVIQFILLCVGLNIVFHGLKKIAEAYDDKQNDGLKEEWHRWDYSESNHKQNQSSHSYSGSMPPPPPPPASGSFSNYNPYEKKSETDNGSYEDVTQQEDYMEQLKKQYKEQKQYYKEQKHFYKDQKNYYKQHKQDYKENYKNTVYQSTFIGDFKFKDSYWQLSPMDLSAFIGDAHIDLTRAEIPVGETTIRMNSFIGDMKVLVPNDPRIGVRVNLQAFIGDSRLFDDKRGGFGASSSMETPFYDECDKRITVELNSFIGDVKVKRVG